MNQLNLFNGVDSGIINIVNNEINSNRTFKSGIIKTDQLILLNSTDSGTLNLINNEINSNRTFKSSLLKTN